MKYVNKELKISFEVDDDYEELDKDEFDADGGTLFIFKNSSGNVFSINIDYGNGESYEDIIGWNIDNLRNVGIVIKNQETFVHEGRRIDVVYSTFESLSFVTYFTFVYGNVITCSIEADEEAEKDLRNLYISIKEL